MFSPCLPSHLSFMTLYFSHLVLLLFLYLVLFFLFSRIIYREGCIRLSLTNACLSFFYEVKSSYCKFFLYSLLMSSPSSLISLSLSASHSLLFIMLQQFPICFVFVLYPETNEISMYICVLVCFHNFNNPLVLNSRFNVLLLIINYN